jgi:hypothetical protein
VISEGPADFAVLRNIAKAVLGLDAADVDSIRPELQTDETSRHEVSPREFSNWEIVKQECLDGSSISLYLESGIDEARLVVIQIDTAECHMPGFDVTRPDRKSDNYVVECYEAVASTLSSWTPQEHAQRLVLAVAVEETDAWLIPLYDSELVSRRRDSGTIINSKEHLFRVLRRTNALTASQLSEILRESRKLQQYHRLSAPLRKPRELRKVRKHNASLDRFIRSLNESSSIEE